MSRFNLSTITRRRLHAVGVACVGTTALMLASCQTTVTVNQVPKTVDIAYLLYAHEVPLPRNIGGDWQVAVERTYTARHGTPMADVILTQSADDSVRVVVWATSSDPNRPGGARGWQAARFCGDDHSDRAKIFDNLFWQGQDCWGVKRNDPIFSTSSNPTVKRLSQTLATSGLNLPATLATVSYRYAKRNELLEVTYGFDSKYLKGLRPPFVSGPRLDGVDLLADWARRFHVNVRLGFHGLLVNGTIPSSTTQEFGRNAQIADEEFAVKGEGTALPSPTLPLHRVKGLVGDVPMNTVHEADLIAQNFERLTFQTEFGGPNPWLRKWNRHPVLRYAKSARPRTRSAIQKTAEQLSDITGLNFSTTMVDSDLSHDIKENQIAGVISVIDAPTNVGGRNCSARIFYGNDGTIRSVIILVGSDYERDGIDECVAEEMAQALGPINDTILVSQSMFNDQTNGVVTALTWHDAIILRALYSSRFNPGTSREKAIPIIRDLILEVLADLHRHNRHTSAIN